MRSLLFALLLPACGGSFSTAPEDRVTEPRSDAAIMADAPTPAPDTAQTDHNAPDASPDSAHDSAAKDHASPVDVVVPPDTSMADCGEPKTVECSGGVFATLPGEYCLYESTEGVGLTPNTPPECLCDFTCACIVAHTSCPSGMISLGCSTLGGAPTLDCEGS